MPRIKKDNIPASFRIKRGVYERLEGYCAESGQPKTVAVERAITMYIDDYERKKKLIDQQATTEEK